MKKRIFAMTAAILCAILVFQSLPVSAVSDALKNGQAENSESTDSTEEATAVSGENTDSEPYILGEVIEERTEDTKIFRMSDGSYTAAVYPTQIHYEKDGAMEEIDYRFKEVSADGVDFYETTEGPVTLRVPKSSGEGGKLEFSSGNYCIAFSFSSAKSVSAKTVGADKPIERLEALRETIGSEILSDEEFAEIYSKVKENAEVLDIELEEAVKELGEIMMTAAGAASSVSYEAVTDNTDIRYSISGTTLKEEIVLKRRTAALKTLSFELDPCGLTPVLGEDGAVSLKDSQGTERLRIAAPFMYDTVGAESTDIEVTLTENGDGTYTYSLKPDRRWAVGAERIYPIVIDPPVTDSSFYTVKDTTGVFASSAGSLSTTGELNYLKVGKRYDSVSGTTPEVQAMLYSALPSALTSTTSIVHAYLNLYSYRGSISTCPNDMQVNAYMITSDWNTSDVNENAPICLGSDGRADYSDILDYVYCNDTEAAGGKLYEFEITDAAQKWVEGSSPNYGIALRASGLGSTESFARFYDSTNLQTSQACPKFIYVYRDSKGIEDYWSFTSMDAGRTGVAAVNNYNGNLVTVHDLVSSTGNNMPVNLSIIYSANSADINGYSGLGMWRTNYHMKIETCDLSFYDVNYNYCFVDSDGTRHYLKEEGTEHKDEDGLGLTLTVENASDYKYKMETKDHTEYLFDYFGRLIKITDRNGNFNFVKYASYSDSTVHRIIYIEEGCAATTERRRTNLTLNETTGDVTVTSPEGRSVTLDFVSASNKMLQGIHFADGVNTIFTFTQIGSGYFPSVIRDGSGHRTDITYPGGGSRRVASLKWGTDDETLQQYSFTYGHNHTKVTDIENRSTTLQFNGFGQTVGTVDHVSAVGQSYEFGAPGGAEKGTENKLLLTSKTIYASENRITNGGFNTSGSINSFSVYPNSDNVTKRYSQGAGNTGTGRMALTKAEGCLDGKFIYQTVSGLRVGKYTLSAYVSTNGGTLSGSGAFLNINVFNSNGYRTGNNSIIINSTNSGEWVRLQATVEIVSGDTRAQVGFHFPGDTWGTVYIDDMQFEYNLTGGAGSFNQLANPSFTGGLGSSWGGSGGYTVSSAPAGAPACLSNTANTSGLPSGVRTLSQSVYVDGNADDVFIVGAWAKGNSIPLTASNERKKGEADFGIHVTFYNGDTVVGTTQSVKFNSGIDGWQFVTDKLTAPGEYTRVLVSLVYNFNTGNVSFGLPFLYKESYGQSYVYDENGNVVSATDAAETQASFAYQDNALTSKLSPTGSRYMYAKYEFGGNLTYALSNSGQRIGFKYNSTGDALYMQINDAEFIPSLSKTYGEKVDCFIVNAKNGRVLQPQSISQDSYVYARSFYYIDECKWQLSYLSGSTYYIRAKNDMGMGLYTNENGRARLGSITYNSDWVPPAKFKYAFETNGDGSFRISTGQSGHTKYLYQTDNLQYVGSSSYTVSSAAYDENDPSFKWYLVSVSSGSIGMKTTATYSDDGNYLTSSADAAGNVTSYEYGANGLVSKSTDPKGTETEYTYDVMNRTTAVTSGTSDVGYTYSGDLLQQISVDGGALTYGFTYDKFGRKTSVGVSGTGGSRTLAGYTYDGRLMTRQSYGSGDTNYIDFEYDNLDRVIKKSYNGNDSSSISYMYDPNGNIYRAEDNLWGRGIQYEYDLAGRINGVTTRYHGTGKMQAYESIRYNDGKGTVKSKSYSVYGTDGQLLRQTPYSFTYGDPSKGEIPDALYKLETSGGSYSYAYDRLARLESRTLTVGNTVKTESYTYAPHPTNAALTTPLVSSMTDLAGKTHTYTYDANGNILTDTYDGNTVSYEYDSLNRMTRYNDPVFGRTYVYVYDDRGNITEMQDHSYTTGALSAYYSSCEYEYGDSTWADLMTSYWGEDIAYDELGNPLNWINGETLTWQNGRQLASVGGVTYGYNADGLRVSKTWARGSTEYYVVDGQYIGEKTVKNGTQYYIYYIYDENGSPAGITVNGTQYWFVKNLQGDVTAILDSSGAVVANYRYDAYGYIISITNGSGANVGLTDTGHIARLNPFRYRGYMYDEETEFYYLRSRYYDPFIGRFLNADSLLNQESVLGNNMFAYCLNNPINMTDDTGNLPFFVITAAIGAVVGAVVGGVVAAKNGGNVWAGIGIGAAVGGLAGAGLGAAAGAVLAGSATATTAAVVSGAGMLATAVSTGGAGAGLALVADNISRTVNNVGTVLYSGGEQARQVATTFANNTGGTTIDPTVIGQVADAASKIPGADFTSVWSQASAAFCNQSSGVVHAFVSNSAYRGVDSIFWSVEMPTLLNNPRVTEIIIHIFE